LTVLGAGILALCFATADARHSRLADIGPAPRTILTDTTGKRFDLASLRGKAVLVSFIFTKCNGVCPATTQALCRIQKTLQKAKLWGTSVAFVSITIDPSHDTTAVLSLYGEQFGADPDNWHFLTGAPRQVEAVVAAWGMWVKSDAGGVLDHSSRIFLVDPRGRQREIYNLEFLQADSVLDDVRLLVREGK
jgi:protein SCO1/2